jgi:hypothetical protein
MAYNLDDLKRIVEENKMVLGNIDITGATQKEALDLVIAGIETVKGDYNTELTENAGEFNALVAKIQTIANELQTSVASEATTRGSEISRVEGLVLAEQGVREVNEAATKTAYETADTALDQKIELNKAKVAVINGDVNTEGSYKKAIQDAVDTLKDGVDINLDTLKELADALNSNEGAGATALATAIANLRSELRDGSGETLDTFKEVEIELGRIATLISNEETNRINAIQAAKDAQAIVNSGLAQNIVDNKTATDAQNDAQTEALKSAKTTLESSISTLGDDVATAMATEKARVDGELATKQTAIEANATAITTADNRAIAAEGVLTTAIADLDTKVDNSVATLNQKINDDVAAAITAHGVDVDTLTNNLNAVKNVMEDESNGEVISFLETLDALADELNSRKVTIAGSAVCSGSGHVVNHGLDVPFNVTVSPKGHVPALVSVEVIDNNSFKVNAIDARYYLEDMIAYTADFNVEYSLSFAGSDLAMDITKTDGTTSRVGK